MTNKNIFLTVGAIVIVLIVGALLLSPQTPTSTSQNATSTGTSYNAKGSVVFGVTDAAPSMGTITSVVLTVTQVSVHSTSSGWVTVSNATKQYDLLALRDSGAISLLASTSVAAGTYDQVRLAVSNVTVVRNGVSQSAKLPSGELKIVGNIVVGSNATTAVVFDFLADKSLHITGEGKLIFAPVIKIEKQDDASFELNSNNELRITSGHREDDENVGMDENGEVKSNFELKGTLNIDANDDVKVINGVNIKY